MTPIASTDCRPELLAILSEARQLLARPENDFADSGWTCQESALQKIGWFIDVIRSGLMPSYPQVAELFSLGGRIEEVARRSGWTADYLEVASRYEPIRRTLFVRHLGPLAAAGRDLPLPAIPTLKSPCGLILTIL